MKKAAFRLIAVLSILVFALILNTGLSFADDVIDINTCTEDELMTLKSIGKGKAKAIIEYREKMGKFKNKEDIMKVKGIGKKIYKKIEDKIICGEE